MRNQFDLTGWANLSNITNCRLSKAKEAFISQKRKKKNQSTQSNKLHTIISKHLPTSEESWEQKDSGFDPSHASLLTI